MKYIAGVDIGNSTTEVCIGEITLEGKVVFLSSASCPTTGTKGTVENTHAIKTALKAALMHIAETEQLDPEVGIIEWEGK